MSHISMLSKLVLPLLCALLHLAGAARGANSAACQAAIDAQGWLLEQFGPQGNPDVQALLETAAAKFGVRRGVITALGAGTRPPLCPAAAAAAARGRRLNPRDRPLPSPPQTPPAKLDQTAWFPTSFQSSWAPYAITNGVGVAPWGSADLGECARQCLARLPPPLPLRLARRALPTPAPTLTSRHCSQHTPATAGHGRLLPALPLHPAPAAGASPTAPLLCRLRPLHPLQSSGPYPK